MASLSAEPCYVSLEVTYLVESMVERGGQQFEMTVLRTTVFTNIDAYYGACIWYAIKMGIRHDILKKFELMVEAYTLLQGDVYVYDSFERCSVKDAGPKNKGKGKQGGNSKSRK